MRLLVLTLLAICAECGAGRTCDADGNCAAPGVGGRNRGGGTAEEHAVVFHSIHAPDLAELRRLLESAVSSGAAQPTTTHDELPQRTTGYHKPRPRRAYGPLD